MLILKAIENVQAVLKERGLDPLPVELYKYYGRMQEYGVPDKWTRLEIAILKVIRKVVFLRLCLL